MPAVKTKPGKAHGNHTGEKAAPKEKAPAAPTAKGPDGWPVTKSGTPDKRYKENPATRAQKTGEPGLTKDERMERIFGGKTWKAVRQGFTQTPIKSVTGAQLKSYLEIEAGDGTRVICGLGEAAKFAHVSAPKKERAAREAKPAKSDGAKGFDDDITEEDATSESEVSTDSEEDLVIDDDDSESDSEEADEEEEDLTAN